MDCTEKNFDELSELIIRLIEGSIDQSSFLRLDEILAENDEAQDYYLDFLEICGGLRQGGVTVESNVGLSASDTVFWDVIDEDIAILEEKEAAERRHRKADEERASLAARQAQANLFRDKKPRRVENYLQLATILALIIVALTIIWGYRQASRPLQTPEVVARITDMENAQWADVDATYQLGQDLVSQPMNLKSGLVELTFSNGAEVILEAP
ncbi:MAG: hypothetical protein JW709_00945, partial [Sedimentisphaerales bacterium]|nr:hypothetical protein [Sedimentisphaerales bacterium]